MIETERKRQHHDTKKRKTGEQEEEQSVCACVRASEIEIDKENDTIFARVRKIISFHDK